VQVTITDDQGVALTTTTNSDGSYSFSGLAPGTYTVTFVLPDGAIFSPQDQGSDDGADSDIAPDGTATITLEPGQVDNTLDAGIINSASLGDFVFNDLDGDGIQDTNELGIGGVQVILTDENGGEQTTTTNDDGMYGFADLLPGSYTVTFILPDGATVSPQDEGDDDSADSDIAPDGTVTVTLEAGEDDDTIDAGIITTASVGDFVFNDLDGDGIQDAGELGIGGVQVTITDEQGVAQTTITDENGQYSFTGLLPGNYTVTFVLPDGSTFSPQDQGGDDGADSDVNPDGTISIVLTAGQINDTTDAGIIQPASLGDRVWFDRDGDGIQDSNDPGLAGITVQLFDGNDELVATTTTDAAGLYEFTQLAPGGYYINVFNPIGGTPTEQDSGGDDTVDSDIFATADGDASRTEVTILSSGEVDPTLDAGYICTPIVGGTIFEDLDSDGQRDSNEAGLPDVFVQIIAESTGQVVADIYTGADGSFLASDLDEDETYTIDANLPFASRELIPTTDEPLQGIEPTFCEAPNEIGYGPTSLGIIGDLVWYDANGNGIPDEWRDANGNGALDQGDPAEWYAPFPLATDTTPDPGGFDACGIANVTVFLLDEDGTEIDSTETDAFGWYNFFNLAEETYTAQVDTTDPDLLAGALAIANSGQCVSSEGTPPIIAPTARRALQELLPGQGSSGELTCRLTTPTSITNFLPVDEGPPTDGINLNFDFGVICEGNGSIGDLVWFDDNGNGILDEDELGANAIQVILTDSQGNTQTTFTDPDGQYLFQNLPPGEYMVTFVLPDGATFTLADATNEQSPETSDESDSDANPADGTTPTITLEAGEDNLTIDAGPDVLVTLADSQGNEQTTTTDGSGRYEFTDLIPGDYTVTFTLPTGAIWTLPNATNDQSPATSDQIDSDVNPEDGSVSVNLAPGENNETIDAGLLRPASLGDFVSLDLDNDGLQDSDEPGVAGVLVELLTEDGTVIESTETDETGFYQFADLAPNVVYVVRFTAPDNLSFTIQNQGSDEERDSDADPITGSTDPITLNSSEFNDTIDAALAPLAELGQLGDRVWEDLNGNGIQDEDDPGISGVTVRLLDGAGEEVDSTTTDEDGLYSFTNLQPGQYQIAFTTPDGFAPTLLDAIDFQSPTTSDQSDSDADPETGLTTIIDLDAGEVNTTFDAGFYRPSSLGDVAWIDLNGDGIQDANEPLLDGVTVQLFLQGEEMPIAEQTTEDGLYLFEGLAPGSYFVIFQQPDGFSFTLQNRGSDDEADSDANPVSGVSPIVSLASGTDDRSLDVGLLELASVGDFVFNDTNGNGIQDPGEEGVSGVVVSIFNQDGTLINQTVSESDGSFLFTDLQPDEYFLAFVQPDGFSFAQPGQGGDPALDSDVDPTTGVSPSFVLTSGEINGDIDAGLNPFSAIGDFVFNDINGNGLQDPTESGLGEITLTLFNDDDNVAVQQTETLPDGTYSFTELTPGNYSVVVERPPGFEFTDQDQGSDDEIDSDVDSSGSTGSISVGFGEFDFTIDAGLRPLSAAIDVEKSTNGVDADEPGTLALAEGETVTWRYVVRNIGNVALNDIELVDDQIGVINGTASCPQTTLGIGETIICTASGTVETGPYVNVATVTGVPAEQPGVTVEDSDSSTYTGVSLNLRIDKTDSVAEATPGEPLEYTLEYLNEGPTTAIDVQIIDNLPAGVTFMEVIQETPAIADDPIVTLVPNANQRVIWQIPELAAGASGVIVFSVNTDPDLSLQTIENQVRIDCFGMIDPALRLVRTFTAMEQSVNCEELDSNPADNEDVELTPFEEFVIGVCVVTETNSCPTAIQLSTFNVADSPDGITVEWVTTLESGTSGFHLYRGTTTDFEKAALINDDIVVAQGEEGGIYSYRDVSALPTVAYYYWLVELENGVEQEPFGPERGRAQAVGTDYTIFLPIFFVDPKC